MPVKNNAGSVSTGKDIDVTWHALSREEVLEKLESGIEEGLSNKEAAKRLENTGPTSSQKERRLLSGRWCTNN